MAVVEQLELRALDFSTTKPISVFCGTWNVNAKSLPLKDTEVTFKEWLWPRASSEPRADVYVIGLQEMVKLNLVNTVLSSSASNAQAKKWIQLLQVALSYQRGDALDSEGYSLIIESHMVGLFACVFVRNSLCGHCSDVRFRLTRTGCYGLTGNKGGLLFRMIVYDSPICFVVAHFHAHEHNVKKRNLDFNNIHKTGSFSSFCLTNVMKSIRSSPLPQDKKQKLMEEIYENTELTLDTHELIFWFGDLNYRISGATTVEVFDAADAGYLDDIRNQDQLNIQRASDVVFSGFEEGGLNFPPTYKFIPGIAINFRSSSSSFFFFFSNDLWFKILLPIPP